MTWVHSAKESPVNCQADAKLGASAAMRAAAEPGIQSILASAGAGLGRTATAVVSYAKVVVFQKTACDTVPGGRLGVLGTLRRMGESRFDTGTTFPNPSMMLRWTLPL